MDYLSENVTYYFAEIGMEWEENNKGLVDKDLYPTANIDSTHTHSSVDDHWHGYPPKFNIWSRLSILSHSSTPKTILPSRTLQSRTILLLCLKMSASSFVFLQHRVASKDHFVGFNW